MRTFVCPSCGGPLYFENTRCACGMAVSYDPERDTFVADTASCANRADIGCNWLAPAPGALCEACAMTRTHPDLSVPQNGELWSRAEAAKRRVLVNLRRWGWLAAADPGARPSFDILAERVSGGAARPVMGHADGHITIIADEADPTEIVRRRDDMDEPYRSMIGHFRHELAHFLWQRLAAEGTFLARARGVFGDERADYAEALARHYANGPPPDWRQCHISAYAASHPHEDWAETAAHVLHLDDLLHSAQAVGLTLPSRRPDATWPAQPDGARDGQQATPPDTTQPATPLESPTATDGASGGIPWATPGATPTTAQGVSQGTSQAATDPTTHETTAGVTEPPTQSTTQSAADGSANMATHEATQSGAPPGAEGADDSAALTAGMDLAIAMNHVNRAMGVDDIYPFVVTDGVRDKLSFARRALSHGPPHAPS